MGDTMSDRIPAIVLGGTGYVSGELLRLILGHPNFELAGVMSDSSPGELAGKSFPHLAGVLGNTAFKSQAEIASLVGLEKPLFDLRNPGLISIPLGFLAVIVGSLLYRDKRAEDMWDELYARLNTGILAAKAAAH